VSQELTIEALLEMTAVQLADSSTQQRRQQQLSNVVLDAMRESTQETLENARREVMAGTDVTSSGTQSSTAPLPEEFERPGLSRESSMDVDRASPGKVSGDFGDDAAAMDVEDNGDEARDADVYESAPSSRSLEIEQRVNSASSPRAAAAPKRPMDADAISRFTSSSARPNKLPRVETEDPAAWNTSAEPGKSSRGVPKESPRVKPPSLLGNILANKAAVAAAAASPHVGSVEPDYEELDDAIQRSKASALGGGTLAQSPVVDAVKLITASGGNEISIARPGHGSGSKSIVMKGEAWVTDRYFPVLIDIYNFDLIC
jgi:hypothetical protein